MVRTSHWEVNVEVSREIVAYLKNSGMEWKNYITFKVDGGKIMNTDFAYVL